MMQGLLKKVSENVFISTWNAQLYIHIILNLGSFRLPRLRFAWNLHNNIKASSFNKHETKEQKIFRLYPNKQLRIYCSYFISKDKKKKTHWTTLVVWSAAQDYGSSRWAVLLECWAPVAAFANRRRVAGLYEVPSREQLLCQCWSRAFGRYQRTCARPEAFDAVPPDPVLVVHSRLLFPRVSANFWQLRSERARFYCSRMGRDRVLLSAKFSYMGYWYEIEDIKETPLRESRFVQR